MYETLPHPRTSAPNAVTIADLIRIAPVLNLKQLCKTADLNYQAIRRKVVNESELDVQQSRALRKALAEVGLRLIEEEE